MEGEFYAQGVKRGPETGAMGDAKKPKFDNGSNPPSRVVHIRGMPTDASETDVVQIGLPFGKMTNVLVLKQKNQAFLEFADESSAVTMVSYYTTNNCQIKLKSCYVQFSNHKELKTDPGTSQNSSAAQALQAAQGYLPKNLMNAGPVEQTAILRVIVDNVLYPVTLDVLHQLFSRFGKILKIITFNKNNTFQALVQFSEHFSAMTARDSLDSQNIYNGCNTLKIDFSRLTNLNVKYNNEKSRDYSRPDLPTGDNDGNGLLGDVGMGGGAGVLGSGANAMLGAGFNMGMGMGNRVGMGGQGGSNTPCILASNLDEESVTPDGLFNLFGVYGNVHRVKILFNKKDNALIQMGDPSQAMQAITHLDKAKVWGKQIRCNVSKHMLIQMPKDGQADAGLTKDFVNNPHQRYKNSKSNSKNYIFPPTSVLHLYNVKTLEEEDIRDLFSQYGTISGFKFFNNDRKMALIQMSTVEQATMALMGLHNYQVAEKLNLRVSFSRSTI